MDAIWHELAGGTTAMAAGLQVDLHFVYVAPGPGFAGLEGFHDGVLGLMEMLGGVCVLRGIAAAYVAALHAQAEMNPGVAHFYAFFAAVGVRCHFANLIQM
jgi:hypothetical protein